MVKDFDKLEMIVQADEYEQGEANGSIKYRVKLQRVWSDGVGCLVSSSCLGLRRCRGDRRMSQSVLYDVSTMLR